MAGYLQLETKFSHAGSAVEIESGSVVSGYASRFGDCDSGHDIVERGAYEKSLARLRAQGRNVKMLWQHNPAEPIGVWDEIIEDATGLFVSGRLLKSVAKGREAIALIGAGAIDGLSIGYRTVQSQINHKGQRILTEIDLWEVSLVTFPMLQTARVDGVKADPESELGAGLEQRQDGFWSELAEIFGQARLEMTSEQTPIETLIPRKGL